MHRLVISASCHHPVPALLVPGAMVRGGPGPGLAAGEGQSWGLRSSVSTSVWAGCGQHPLPEKQGALREAEGCESGLHHAAAV